MKHVCMAVVIRSGKVLIQRRYRHNKGLVYEFPGGAIDAGESAEQSARRELREETGLPCGRLLGNHVAQNQWGGEIHYIVLAGLADAEPVAVNAQRQQSFYWLEPQQIPLDDFYPADVQFIQNQLSAFVT